MSELHARVLVACVGNIFLGDDGFGSHVAAALAAAAELPDGVRVVDYGIRSVHLVYELMNGYDVLVLVDTVGQQDGPPGTLYVIEPDLAARDGDGTRLPEVAARPARPVARAARWSWCRCWAARVDRILVVGVQPETLDDGIGLSDAVAAAVEPAADLVVDVVTPRARPGSRHRASPEEVDEVKKLFMLVVARRAAAAVAVASLPDIKRYLEMRRM